MGSNDTTINMLARGFKRQNSKPLSIRLHDTDSIARPVVEDFIRQIFAQAYGANISQFYPSLLAVNNSEKSYAAVAGFREATEHRLFAEFYLDKPIEDYLNQRRDSIVEVGNLAPASAGQARWLIACLTGFLHSAEFTTAVFTAVPALVNAFRRVGIPLTRLSDAKINSLPVDHHWDWGSYYELKPAVYAADVNKAYETLNQVCKQDISLQKIWLDACREGQLYRFTRLSQTAY